MTTDRHLLDTAKQPAAAQNDMRVVPAPDTRGLSQEPAVVAIATTDDRAAYLITVYTYLLHRRAAADPAGSGWGSDALGCRSRDVGDR